jgi:hypothetical protein
LGVIEDDIIDLRTNLGIVKSGFVREGMAASILSEFPSNVIYDKLNTKNKKIMESISNEIENEFMEEVKLVTNDNFVKMADSLVEIILKYKGKLNNKKVDELLLDVYNEIEIDENQDDVLTVVSCRVVGFCSPHNYIQL